MPAKPAFTGQRAEFLDSKREGYVEALKTGTGRDFIAGVVRQFSNHWPPEMLMEVERSAEELASVDDSLPQPDVGPPNPDTMEPAEYHEKLSAYNDRKTIVALRKGQIERHLKRHGDQANIELNQKAQNPYNLLLAQLTGMTFKTKPCQIAAANLWAKENTDIVNKSLAEKRGKRAAEKEKEKGKGKGKDKTENQEIPKMWKDVVSEAWSKLSNEEKSVFQIRAKEIFDAEMKAWETKVTSPPPTNPRSRQNAINNLAKFVTPILKGIAEQTGWHVSLVAGGPEPLDSGRINVMSVHSGTTTGDITLTWGQDDSSTWREVIFPSFASFCIKGFSKEECRSRALPKDEEGEESPPSVAGPNEKQAMPDEVITFTADDFDKTKTNSTSVAPSAVPTAAQATSFIQQQPAARKTSTENEARPTGVVQDPSPHPSPSSLHPAGGQARIRPRRHSVDVPPSPEKAVPVQVRARTSRAASSPLRQLPIRNNRGSDEEHIDTQLPSLPTSPIPSPVHSPVPSPVHSPTTSRASSPRLTATPSSSAPPSVMAEDKIYEGPLPEGTRDTEHVAPPAGTKVSSKQTVRRGGRQSAASRSERREANAKKTKKRPLEEDQEPPSTQKRPRKQSHPSTPSIGQGSSARPSSQNSLDISAPAGCPAYMERIVALAKDVNSLEDWRDLLEAWFLFEEANNHGQDDSGRLGTTHRPEWVGAWIGRARLPRYRPQVNVAKVIDGLLKWWKGCQPVWREFDDENLPIPKMYVRDGDRELAEWKDLVLAGPNGLSSVVACLAYAALKLPGMPRETGREKLTHERYCGFLELLVQDLIFVLRKLSRD
ncbi:SERTA domain-containing protein 3 [Marasmius crinis-equi]|uniref:SERTA domain-containing protein 3 n=1 Tax=Marasmius crinis-equi TaxID=585013 RepID=A0ABR3EZV0_9AGAR